MRLPRVLLTGGDGHGWACDDDLERTRQSLLDCVEFADLRDCDVVHSVWWDPLARLPPEHLEGRRLVCHASGEPLRCLTIPGFRQMLRTVGLWIAQSTQATAQLRQLDIPCVQIPYAVDIATFHPLSRDDERLQALREKCSLPTDRYLIGSFQRDSEGANLHAPKLVKGPDLFAETVHLLARRGFPVHVVLAGPRRHWLRGQLAALGVSHTFIGEPQGDDDLHRNTLSRAHLNLLYNLIDLCVVTSRSEGAPRCLLEAGAAKCPVISTPVGIAPDLLPPEWIRTAPVETASLISEGRCLERESALVEQLFCRVHEQHVPEANRPRFEEIYRDWESIGPSKFPGGRLRSRRPSPLRRVAHRLGLARVRPGLTVSIWHTFHRPPWGGGNQFMMALRQALQQRGHVVRSNSLSSRVDVHLLNSIHFDVDRLMSHRGNRSLCALHRIDGPICLVRGSAAEREKDDLCFELNRRFASVTVLQSRWTLERFLELGYRPINPVVIPNAVDPSIFHTRGRVAFDHSRRVRLIASSWSDNPRKGGEIYRWLEEHLDGDRFEFTFVGRLSEPLRRARHIPPQPSEQLADLLRQHDIYVTASQCDPCSNALIEALSCGLPALFLDDGGHPELVAQGGLPFRDREEIPGQLERLVENYQMYQRLITAPTMDGIVSQYDEALREATQGRGS